MSVKQGRFEALDGWRGVLALVVMSYHYGWPEWPWYPRRGPLAVDIFFLLSGFVLTFAFDEKRADGRVSAWGFFVARVKRLLPLHLIVLSVVMLFAYGMLLSGYMLDPDHWNTIEVAPDWRGFPWVLWDAALLTQFPTPPVKNLNWWGLNGVSWSIACELYFGLVLLFFFGRRGWLPVIIAALLGAAAYAAVLLTQADLTGSKEVVWLTNDGNYRAVGGFLLGYAAYKAFAWLRPSWSSWSLNVFATLEYACAAALVYIIWQGEPKLADCFIPPVGVLVLLVFAEGRGPVSWLLKTGPFQILGALSFHVYLWHSVTRFMLESLGIGEWSVTVTLLAAVMTWLLLDYGFIGVAWRQVHSLIQRPVPVPAPAE